MQKEVFAFDSVHLKLDSLVVNLQVSMLSVLSVLSRKLTHSHIMLCVQQKSREREREREELFRAFFSNVWLCLLERSYHMQLNRLTASAAVQLKLDFSDLGLSASLLHSSDTFMLIFLTCTDSHSICCDGDCTLNSFL